MKKNKTLIVATSAAPTNADPDFGHSFADSLLYTNLNDPLLRSHVRPYLPDSNSDQDVETVIIDDALSLNPNLCESWSESSDKIVTTFHLQQGIYNHWGNELTTADVRYTIDRAFAVRASIFYFLNSFAGIPSPDHCRVLDDYTFELHTPVPTGVVLKLLCSPWIATFDHLIASQYSTNMDPWSLKWMTRNSCSWGPYNISEWNEGKDVTLETVNRYWKGKPNIEKVVVKTYPLRTDLITMLERGEIDIIDRLLPKEVEYLNEKEGIRVLSTQSTGVYQLIMNCQMKPFDDIRVRQAMNFICPQERIISEVFRGNAEPMTSPCSPLQPGFTDQYWKYTFDPDKAAALLAEAGYDNGFDIQLAYSDNSPAEELACKLYQEALQAINVRGKLQKMTVPEFNRKLYLKEHRFASKFTFTVVRDPAYWGLWYRSGTFLNYQDLRDTELDQLLTQQSRILDPGDRAEFSKTVQERILDLAPMVFVAYPLMTAALRDNISGQFHVNPDSLSFYWSDLDKD